MMNCPYCGITSPDTADHVFPQFLGGTRKIPACRGCNSTAGHTIEAAVSADLKVFLFHLSQNGYLPRKRKGWSNIVGKTSGTVARINADRDGKVSPATPEVLRDGFGKVTGIRGGPQHVEGMRRTYEKSGRPFRMREYRTDIPDFEYRLTFSLSEDFKRLALKMAVALCRVARIDSPLDSYARDYLLRGINTADCPVRMGMQRYPELDVYRPQAGHLVIVRANATEQRLTAVVQVHTLMQFDCLLNSTYRGPNRTFLGTCDPITGIERFTDIATIDLPLPSPLPTQGQAERMVARFKLLQDEMIARFGAKAERFSNGGLDLDYFISLPPGQSAEDIKF